MFFMDARVHSDRLAIRVNHPPETAEMENTKRKYRVRNVNPSCSGRLQSALRVAPALEAEREHERRASTSAARRDPSGAGWKPSFHRSSRQRLVLGWIGADLCK